MWHNFPEWHHGMAFHHAAWGHPQLLICVLLFLFVVVPVVVTLFWVLPITLGVRVARRRNYSPLWMLFGIHPIGGWIACLVLSLSPGKVECPTCGGYVRRNYRQCPHCHGAIPPSEKK